MVLPEWLKIMKPVMNVIILAISLAALSATAQVPDLISHQGKVTVVGTDYTGADRFKFALVDATGANAFWSPGGSQQLTPGRQITSVGYAIVAGSYAETDPASTASMASGLTSGHRTIGTPFPVASQGTPFNLNSLSDS